MVKYVPGLESSRGLGVVKYAPGLVSSRGLDRVRPRTVFYFCPGIRMTDPGANSRILAYHIGIPLPVSYANRASGSLLSSLELGTSVSDSRSPSYILGHKVS